MSGADYEAKVRLMAPVRKPPAESVEEMPPKTRGERFSFAKGCKR
jgi:hypothetical protein